MAEMTASTGTFENSAIFSLVASWSGAFVRQSEDVGLDADAEHLLDGVLRGLRLQLARRLDVRHERDVHAERVLASASTLSCRTASRKGSDSMSPTVPPISMIATSASARPRP